MDDLSVSAELLPQIPDLTQEEWYLPEEDNPLQDIMNIYYLFCCRSRYLRKQWEFSDLMHQYNPSVSDLRNQLPLPLWINQACPNVPSYDRSWQRHLP